MHPLQPKTPCPESCFFFFLLSWSPPISRGKTKLCLPSHLNPQYAKYSPHPKLDGNSHVLAGKQGEKPGHRTGGFLGWRHKAKHQREQALALHGRNGAGCQARRLASCTIRRVARGPHAHDKSPQPGFTRICDLQSVLPYLGKAVAAAVPMEEQVLHLPAPHPPPGATDTTARLSQAERRLP